MANKRRKIHEELEVVKVGFANGIAEGFPFTDKQKNKMIDKAEKAYGKFLDALKFHYPAPQYSHSIRSFLSTTIGKCYFSVRCQEDRNHI